MMGALMLGGINPLRAEENKAVISLFDNTPAEAEAAAASAASKKTPDNDIFSFLNFKKKNKEEPKLNIADEKRLSPFEQSLKLASEGDVDAQLAVGYSYLYGANGAEVNYDKAFEYYAMAAVQNDPVGLNNLGSLYYSGIGVERSPAKAHVLFEKAANLGNAEAAVNLAFILISGNGAEKNPAQAMQWFEKSAAQENPTAQFMLGYAYYSGKLRPRDYKKAAELVKKAASAGIDEAQYTLALMYVNGLGLPQNYGNAVKFLKGAVAQGSTEAMMTLGDILARGEKYSKDLYTAHVMFNLASVRGAQNAAEKRDAVEAKLKIEEVLQAQTEAERFVFKPTELSQYVHKTFGPDLRSYVNGSAR